MIELTTTSVYSMGLMVITFITPFALLWEAILKRKPYISEVKKGVEY